MCRVREDGGNVWENRSIWTREADGGRYMSSLLSHDPKCQNRAILSNSKQGT